MCNIKPKYRQVYIRIFIQSISSRLNIFYIFISFQISLYLFKYPYIHSDIFIDIHSDILISIQIILNPFRLPYIHSDMSLYLFRYPYIHLPIFIFILISLYSFLYQSYISLYPFRYFHVYADILIYIHTTLYAF